MPSYLNLHFLNICVIFFGLIELILGIPFWDFSYNFKMTSTAINNLKCTINDFIDEIFLVLLIQNKCLEQHRAVSLQLVQVHMKAHSVNWGISQMLSQLLQPIF